MSFQSLDNPLDLTGHEEELNSFLESFEPVVKKYDHIWMGTRDDPQKGYRQITGASLAAAARFAQDQDFDNLTRSKYSSIADNLRLVYGDTYVVQKDVRSFHLAESKIIQSYLGIQNLGKLFDEDFFNFEWDIHTQQDFESHKHGYQRDHFVHQIRNLWEMDTMLEQYGFYEASKCVLMDKDASPVSRYVSIKCKQFLEDSQSETAQLVRRMPSFRNSTEEEQRDYLESWFYKYVIFGASYLAALFHDLGYPVVHFLNMRQRLSEYSPASNMFVRNGMPGFDSLSGKLSDSLLFNVESGEHIRKSMEAAGGKYDHGVYSALPFLLHFYDSGLIYRLAPEKVCAIELAAVAIYGHNLSMFNCVEEGFKAEYYRPYFNQNPITFLLRTCDDLEEWDRRYFEITGDSDLLFCPVCHHPMMKRPFNENGTHRYGVGEPSPKRFQYQCACRFSEKTKIQDERDKNHVTWKDLWPIRQEDFLKRKIFLIRACDRVTFSKVHEKDNVQLPYFLRVGVHYDLYRLLELSKFSFAAYRIKDLNKLKKRLSGQNYHIQSGCPKAPEAIYLDTFLSANPITIKVKILERWLLSQGIQLFDKEMSWEEKCEQAQKELLDKLVRYRHQFRFSLEAYLDLLGGVICMNDQIAEIKADGDRKIQTAVGQRIKDAVKAAVKQQIKDAVDAAVDAAIKRFTPSIDNPTLKKYTESLIKDCFRQYKEDRQTERLLTSIVNGGSFTTEETDAYENLNKDGKNISDTIRKYCYADTDFNMKPTDKHEWLNYYEDLFIFYVMNEDIKESESRL